MMLEITMLNEFICLNCDLCHIERNLCAHDRAHFLLFSLLFFTFFRNRKFVAFQYTYKHFGVFICSNLCLFGRCRHLLLLHTNYNLFVSVICAKHSINNKLEKRRQFHIKHNSPFFCFFLFDTVD